MWHGVIGDGTQAIGLLSALRAQEERPHHSEKLTLGRWRRPALVRLAFPEPAAAAAAQELVSVGAKDDP